MALCFIVVYQLLCDLICYFIFSHHVPSITSLQRTTVENSLLANTGTFTEMLINGHIPLNK